MDYRTLDSLREKEFVLYFNGSGITDRNPVKTDQLHTFNGCGSCM